MIALTYKAKNYASLALKVGILSFSFYYLYTKLWEQQLFLDPWLAKISRIESALALVGLLCISMVNWLLESKKWQLLVRSFRELPFQEATFQTVTSLTVSVATPNRIGEYGAKAYFYPAQERKRILFLNAWGNMSQMAVTCLFGLFGLLLWKPSLMIPMNSTVIVGFLSGLIVLLMMVYLLSINTNLPLYRFFKKLKKYMQSLDRRTQIWVMGLSIGRYLLFSTQFYLILHLLDANVTLIEAVPLIYLMYLMVSLLPMLPFLDIVVKGSVAVWLFQPLGIGEMTILATTLGSWIFNLVIPSIFGSFQLIKAPN